MNKEKLLQLLSEALDKDCSISIHFSQYQGEQRLPVSKEDARELAVNFVEALGAEKIRHDVGQEYADDYVVDTGEFRVVCNYIPTFEEKSAGKRKKIEELKKELAELEKDEEVTA